MSEPLYRNSDRRRAERYGARFDVRFSEAKDAAKALQTFAVNFSTGGLCLKTQLLHREGDILQVHLTIENEVFELKGTIAWVHEGVVGVRFLDVSPEDRARLESVAGLLEKKGRRLPF